MQSLHLEGVRVIIHRFKLDKHLKHDGIVRLFRPSMELLNSEHSRPYKRFIKSQRSLTIIGNI